MVLERLDLEPEEIPVELEFLDRPADAFVKHTLAPVRVRVSAGGDPAPHEEEVTLSLESGELSGTAAAASQDGVAEFRDLSVTTVEQSTRLVAEAKGCEPALSASFAVREDSASPAVGEEAISVQDAEEAIFFGDGRALALLLPGRVVAYDLTGRELDGRDRRGRVRVVRTRGGTLALAEWSGDVHLLFSDGRLAETWRFGEDGRPAVPGDVAVQDGAGLRRVLERPQCAGSRRVRTRTTSSSTTRGCRLSPCSATSCASAGSTAGSASTATGAS